MTTPKFITLEGIEGVGKSSAMEVVTSALKSASINYILTREPGGTKLAEGIRELLLETRDEPMMPLTEALLFFAGREQNISQMIKPALANGQWVVSDRFTDSSLAYQGGGRGVARERLDQLADWVHDGLKPDLTILLDAPAKIGMQRIESRKKDRIEAEKNEFFERIRQTYLQLAADDATRYRIVDATQSLEKVQQDISTIMQEIIKR